MTDISTPQRNLLRWGGTVLIGGGAIAAYVAVALLASALTGDAIAGSAIANAAALAMAVAYRWLTTGSPLASASQPRALTFDFWMYALGALTAFWLAGQTAAAWAYRTWGSSGFDAVSATKLDSPVWLVLLASLVLAPIGEEALIRGVAYPELRRHWPPAAAALVTALVFSLMHGNIVQIVLTVPLGVLLALVYEACRRLWPIILMHMLFNVASTFTPKGFIEIVTSPVLALVFGAVGVVILMLGLVQRPRLSPVR